MRTGILKDKRWWGVLAGECQGSLFLGMVFLLSVAIVMPALAADSTGMGPSLAPQAPIYGPGVAAGTKILLFNSMSEVVDAVAEI